MGILEWIRNIFKPALSEFEKTRAEDALLVVNDAIAQATLRRLETGLDSEGDEFSPYSDGYKKLREDRGRQTDYKDYNFTGEFNRSIYSEVTKQDKKSVTVSINVRGRDNEMKVRGAIRNEQNKRGVSEEQANPLALSDEEINLALAAYAERRVKRIQKGLK